MRLLPTCIFLVAASATIPAFSQSSSKSDLVSPGSTASAQPAGNPSAAQPGETSAPPVSATALRADIVRQDKTIKNQIDKQQDLLKKNKDLMKQAQKLEEKNKKLEAKNRKLQAKNQAFSAEKKGVEAQNADLAKKSDAIKAAERPIQTPAN